MTAKLAKKIGCGKQKIKFFIVWEGLRRSIWRGDEGKVVRANIICNYVCFLC